MSAGNRIQNAALALFGGTRVGNALAALFNRYEGAQPSSPQRSFLPAFVRDARYDANSFTRWELTRKIRYFERNTWLVQRIRDEYVKWSVGPNGLQVIPESSDDEWNAIAQEQYLEWCEGPCLDSTLTMQQCHRLMAGERHIDGELFVNLTRRKDTGKASVPAIQLIESHRCSSPGMEYTVRDIDSQVDGVELDRSTGEPTRPVGYWIRDGLMDSMSGGTWKFRSVDDMIHIFSPTRIGMFRDITPYHAVLNTLHDLDDLEMFEMQRAKANAEDAKIFKTITGELPRSQLLRQSYNSGTGSGSTMEQQNADQEKRLEMYKKVLGARTIALRPDEEMITPTNNSPSASTQWYWQYKIGQICAATSVPLIIVFPEIAGKLQGTAVRGVYDNAHMFFRGEFFIFASAAKRIYRYWLNWARYNNKLLADAPADWFKCHVIPPRAVNVDVGYNAQATVLELSSGLTDLDTEAGKRNTTSGVILRRQVRNIINLKRICAEESKKAKIEVKPEEILESLAELKAQTAQQNPAPEEDPEEDPEENPEHEKETVST